MYVLIGIMLLDFVVSMELVIDFVYLVELFCMCYKVVMFLMEDGLDFYVEDFCLIYGMILFSEGRDYFLVSYLSVVGCLYIFMLFWDISCGVKL